MNKFEASVRINCDAGEGVEQEFSIFDYIDSCSIACGGHFGDKSTMRETVNLAKQKNVLIGAHPSYPDRDHFGRKSMVLEGDELKRTIREQIENLRAILLENKVNLHHIKAHGALYNDCVVNAEIASAYLDAIDIYKNEVLIYLPYGSVIAELANERGFKILFEAFADRNYNEDLSLVSRSSENSLLQDPAEVVNHIRHMVEEGQVQSLNGKKVAIKADTFCIHGDTPSAFKIVSYIRQAQFEPKNKP